MCSRSIKVSEKVFGRAGMGLLGAAALMLPAATSVDAKPGFRPVIIRGAGTPAPAELNLAYLASFPNGSLAPALDKLNAGPMKAGDTGIPNSNPTLDKRPGAIILGITRPVDLSPDLVVAQTAWATQLNLGPGSVSRIRATFIAPVGPIPGGGFAIGVGAKTGGSEDLPDEPRIFTTINVRPGFVVRLQVPFGALETTNTTLSQEIKDLIFSTTNPQPFTIELTIDRKDGTGQTKLTVGDKVVGPLSFHLDGFPVDSGPTISAMGAGPAVNANGPGQTASVHVRDFRIYTKNGG
jgi:hypothetical protein